MGRRGPERKTDAELGASGSTLVSTRRAERRAQAIEARRQLLSARELPPESAILDPADHARILREQTGYDPHRGAHECAFDPVAAHAAVAWLHRHVVHLKGEWSGRAFLLEPWQQAVVMSLWGWRRADGTRRYREALIYVPRGNGKTFLAAGISLLGFLADDEPGAEVFCAAAERKQARILWDQARQMILLDAELASECDVGANAVTKVDDPLATFQPVSSEATSKHGGMPHLAVLDELHVQPDRHLYEAIRTGMGKRREPLFVMLTTARWWDPGHICDDVYEHGCRVRDGVIEDPTFLPVIYEAKHDADWTSEAVWRRANPNWGVSVKPAFLRAELAKAKAQPSEIDPFRRLYLNVRTNAERSAIDIRQWDACPAGWARAALKGQQCRGALDLSKTVDLTAFALWFPAPKTLLLRFYVPRETAMRAELRDRVPYHLWTVQGWVVQTPGAVVDYGFVREDVLALCREFAPGDVGFDPWNGEQMAQELVAAGVPMVKFPQTAQNYNAACKDFERMVVAGELGHGGDPVLRWCASNLMWCRDTKDNIYPDKRRSRGRIDGVTAACMAIGRAIAEPAPVQSNLEKYGIRRLGQ